MTFAISLAADRNRFGFLRRVFQYVGNRMPASEIHVGGFSAHCMQDPETHNERAISDLGARKHCLVGVAIWVREKRQIVTRITASTVSCEENLKCKSVLHTIRPNFTMARSAVCSSRQAAERSSFSFKHSNALHAPTEFPLSLGLPPVPFRTIWPCRDTFLIHCGVRIQSSPVS